MGLAGASPTSTAPPPSKPRREPIPERVRHEVWRRDQGTCVDCGSRDRLEFDHIIPVSRGGANTARNLELRCERCNGRKGARI
jgi:5-methylcytosine-specific restriction endonuclease McrA